MKAWPYGIVSCSPLEVRDYCVNDHSWQRFRLSLKGLTTERKLKELEYWLFEEMQHSRRGWVQVSNYINALKRGGQLTMNLEVQR